MLKHIKNEMEKLITTWQHQLGEDVQVVLGGSLVSELFVLDQETQMVDVDVRFLVQNPLDPAILQKVSQVTGLSYQKTIVVNDWPPELAESSGIMVRGILSIADIPLPLAIEGCIRNRNYVGWAKYYALVLTAEELSTFRRQKQELRRNRQAYKALKFNVLQKVQQRCVEQGLVIK